MKKLSVCMKTLNLTSLNVIHAPVMIYIVYKTLLLIFCCNKQLKKLSHKTSSKTVDVTEQVLWV
jgi:hypothetical protein